MVSDTLCKPRISFNILLCTTCLPMCVFLLLYYFDVAVVAFSVLHYLLLLQFFFSVSHFIQFILFLAKCQFGFCSQEIRVNAKLASGIANRGMRNAEKRCIICVSVSVDSKAFFHVNEKCKKWNKTTRTNSTLSSPSVSSFRHYYYCIVMHLVANKVFAYNIAHTRL